MNWLDHIAAFWPHLVAAFTFLAAMLAGIHALLNKRDSRAAVLWLGFIWLLPFLGPILYLTLGVNRIRRRALALGVQSSDAVARSIPQDLGEPEQVEAEHLRTLARAVDRVASRPLTAGNDVRVLINGDEAFPAMLSAIEGASRTIALSTYIFDSDRAGVQFVEALGRAVARGVAVRALIDAAGSRYSWPPITHKLRRARVPTARFLPALAPWRLLTVNLRNHRKSLIVDGRTAFTGGINIRHGNVLKENPKQPVQDLHFRVEGPAVAQLQDAFANDWAFCTNESLDRAKWIAEPPAAGNVIARVITDGPDADFETVWWTYLAALADAQTSVQILTPYFLPDPPLITALSLAALRGVRVDIILPSRNNLPYVHWASRAMWWQVLERGCRLWLTPPPFDHAKLMIVDGHWVLLGSANWDTRSLRLNFELDLECYGREFARGMAALLARKLQAAREVTLDEVDGRSLPCKLRDAAARLFSPYL